MDWSKMEPRVTFRRGGGGGGGVILSLVLFLQLRGGVRVSGFSIRCSGM